MFLLFFNDEIHKFITLTIYKSTVQFSSVAQSCPTLCDPMNRSTPGLPVHHQLPEFTQTHVHRVGDGIQPSHPLSSLLLLPPIPPRIRVFSNESTLPMRWPKYWSFSFSISPSNEHPGLISFRMDWLDFLAVQGTLKSLFHHYSTEWTVWISCTHRHHQMLNTEIRLIIFFVAKDGEALYSQQKQDWELPVAQMMNSLLPNSD